MAESTFIISKAYQKLQEDLIEANYQLSKAYGYKEAFVSRGNVLDNLQKLYLSNYYAEYRNRQEVSPQVSASEMLDSALKKRKKKKVKEDE